jgi:hypothetical protein
VTAVWIVRPRTREVVTLSAAGESRSGGDASISAIEGLPGLAVRTDALFVQLGGG